MRPELLVLLDERRAKAAVAWQFVTRQSKQEGRVPFADELLVEAFPGVWYSPKEWMALAGLSRHDHGHVAPFLFKADAVGPDGSVSPEAKKYASTLAAAALGGRKKRDG